MLSFYIVEILFVAYLKYTVPNGAAIKRKIAHIIKNPIVFFGKRKTPRTTKIAVTVIVTKTAIIEFTFCLKAAIGFSQFNLGFAVSINISVKIKTNDTNDERTKILKKQGVNTAISSAIPITPKTTHAIKSIIMFETIIYTNACANFARTISSFLTGSAFKS